MRRRSFLNMPHKGLTNWDWGAKILVSLNNFRAMTESQGTSWEMSGQVGEGPFQANVILTSVAGKTLHSFSLHSESIEIKFSENFDPSDIMNNLLSGKIDDKVSEAVKKNADILEKNNEAMERSMNLVNQNCETLNNITKMDNKIKEDIEGNKCRPQWLNYGFMITTTIALIAIFVDMNFSLGGRIDSLIDSLNGRIDTLSGQINEIYQLLLQSKKF